MNFYQTVRNDSRGDGYYYTFIESNRNEEITARATTGLDTSNKDTLFFPSSDVAFGEEELDERTYSSDELEETARFLEEGGQVVISFEPSNISEPTVQLLEKLTDEFAIEMGDETWQPGDGEIPDPKQIDGFHNLVSAQLDIEDYGIGTLPPRQLPSEDTYREEAQSYDEDDFDLYLYDVRAHTGEPLVEAELGDDHYTTIAQRKTVGDGELIIFVQDGFFRNRTMGTDELLRPESFFRSDIVEFQHQFLDYLRGD